MWGYNAAVRHDGKGDGYCMITTETIEEITQLLVGKFNPEKVILFGSHASGGADEQSDVDLLVVAETNLKPQRPFPGSQPSSWRLPLRFRRNNQDS